MKRVNCRENGSMWECRDCDSGSKLGNRLPTHVARLAAIRHRNKTGHKTRIFLHAYCLCPFGR